MTNTTDSQFLKRMMMEMKRKNWLKVYIKNCVLFRYCCITNHSNTQYLKTICIKLIDILVTRGLHIRQPCSCICSHLPGQVSGLVIVRALSHLGYSQADSALVCVISHFLIGFFIRQRQRPKKMRSMKNFLMPRLFLLHHFFHIPVTKTNQKTSSDLGKKLYMFMKVVVKSC